MAYKIYDRDVKWQPRKGLEGPFCYANGRVLYYDVKEGKYWDPLTDFFVDHDEIAFLHAETLKLLTN